MKQFTFFNSLKVIVGTLFFCITTLNAQNWSSIGTGTNNEIKALANFNGELIAAGLFTTAGGNSCNHIARWDGTSWQPVGLGVNDNVYALNVYNSAYLVAAGKFTTAGGVSAPGIALWNGTNWLPLGSSTTNGDILALTSNTNIIYAGGNFTNIAGVNANRVAAFNGTWSALGTGTNNTVNAVRYLGTFLYAGGAYNRR